MGSKVERVRRVVLVALVGSAVVLAACSDGGDAGGPAPTDPAATPTSGEGGDAAPGDTADEPEAFTGTVDEFYEVPDPLPPAPPGTLIRTMPVDADDGYAGLRIMYHSTDGQGDDRAVTGLVYWPEAPAPDGGWPVVAWAHGTTGLAPPCAPSRSPGLPPRFGVDGVIVATDYIGLGPVGEIHPYLDAAAEGHAVIDSVAAARSLPDVETRAEWLLAGLSQGGHAALVSAERAAERLPDVPLLGTVAVAPGSQLGETHGDELQTRIITAMVLVGVAAEDPSVDIEDYLGEAALPGAEAIRTTCLDDVIGSMLGAAASPDFFVTDPRTTVLGGEWLEQNDAALVASEAPLLLVHAGRDAIVVPARTAALVERLCSVGQVVEVVEVPDGTHDSVTGLAVDQISAWFADRLAGEAPTDDC